MSCKACGYFQAKLDEYGYRTRLIMHDAYISLPGKARVDVDNQTLTAITHSFSRSSPPNGVTGRLVYVGEGDASDFSGRDLRGAIVLMEGIASPGQAARASHAGAVGQVQISPHEHLHEMCVSPVWGSPSGETQSELPDHRRLHGVERRRQRAARAPGARRAAEGDAACRGRYRLAADADT